LFQPLSTFYTMDQTPKDNIKANEEFNVGSRGMGKLLAKATPADGTHTGLDSDRNLAYYDNGRLSKYSIQFQGCHHVRHWNPDADDGNEEDVRVYTKRLVRFRLVPYAECHSYNPWMDSTAIKSAQSLLGKADYGDYVVDMTTFIEAYLEAKTETEQANSGDDDDAYGYKADDDGFALGDFTQCAAFTFNDSNGDEYDYYLGPYCANQGGEIKLNLFSDNACTTVAKCGNNNASRGVSCYNKLTGGKIPYTQQSIVENPCVPCSENYAYLESIPDSEKSENLEDYDFGYTRDVCTNLYDYSGKCEKYMQNGQYDYGCGYINGIKMGVSKDGYAVGVKRSLPADAFLATMAISTTFIGMYIYYLKYKIKQLEKKNFSNNFYVPSRVG